MLGSACLVLTAFLSSVAAQLYRRLASGSCLRILADQAPTVTGARVQISLRTIDELFG